MQEAITCPCCFEEYHQPDRLPRLIIQCGHTICSQCLHTALFDSNIPKCPLDEQHIEGSSLDIEQFPVNSALIHILETKIPWDVCSVHKKKKKLICIDHECKLCMKCVLQGEHKDHNLKYIEEIRAQNKAKQQELNKALRRCEEHYGNIMKMVDEEKEFVQGKIKEKFKEIHFYLQAKELSLMWKADSYFEGKRKSNQEHLGDHSEFKQSLIEKLEKYEGFFNDENVLKNMKDDIQPIISQLDSASLAKSLQNIKNIFRTASNKFLKGLENNADCMLKSEVPFEDSRETSHKEFENLANYKGPLDIKLKDDVLTIFMNPLKESKKGIELEEDHKDFSKISKVEIILEEYSLITREEIWVFFDIWQKAKSIASLKVHFKPKGLTDHILIQLFPVIFNKVGTLRNLVIELQECKITDFSLINLFSDVLSKAGLLISLKLDVCSTYISDNALQAFPKVLPDLLGRLKNLSLNFFNTSISDSGMVPFFGEMRRIKYLCLHLQKTKITDETIGAFAVKALPTMEALESLNLYLGETRLTDDGLIRLFQQMRDVRNLELGLVSTYVTDRCIEVFSKETIAKLTSLQGLVMNVGNTGVTRVYANFLEKLMREFSCC